MFSIAEAPNVEMTQVKIMSADRVIFMLLLLLKTKKGQQQKSPSGHSLTVPVGVAKSNSHKKTAITQVILDHEAAQCHKACDSMTINT
jgi:hypothetical protein